MALPSQSLDRRLDAGLAWLGLAWLGDEWGLDERSRKPAAPSMRKRSTHLATVLGVVRNSRAAQAFDRPRRSRCAPSPLDLSASETHSRTFHSVLPESPRCGDIRVHRSNRMHNLLKDHTLAKAPLNFLPWVGSADS